MVVIEKVENEKRIWKKIIIHTSSTGNSVLEKIFLIGSVTACVVFSSSHFATHMHFYIVVFLIKSFVSCSFYLIYCIYFKIVKC